MDLIIEQALEKMMSEVDELTEQLNKDPLIEEIRKKKRLINEFSKSYGGKTIYDEGSLEEIKIYSGQFKGSSLSKAVKWFLEKRGKEKPATYEEIMEALRLGDYDGKVGDIRKVIMKNNQITLLKGGNVQKFGLTEWYEKRKRSTKDESAGNEEENEDENEEINDESAQTSDEHPKLDLDETKK